MSTLIEKLEALLTTLEWKSGQDRYTNGARAQAGEDARSIRALLADNAKEGEPGDEMTLCNCGAKGGQTHAEDCPAYKPGYVAYSRLAPAAPEAIMAGNGHPDEGPCVVCGAVFDTHAPGCVFEEPAAALALEKRLVSTMHLAAFLKDVNLFAQSVIGMGERKKGFEIWQDAIRKEVQQKAQTILDSLSPLIKGDETLSDFTGSPRKEGEG